MLDITGQLDKSGQLSNLYPPTPQPAPQEPVGSTSADSTTPVPTVFSNANVIEKTIPDLNDRLAKLKGSAQKADEKPQPEITLEKAGTTPNGEQMYLDPVTGLIETVSQRNARLAPTTAPATADDKAETDLIASLKANLDAQTKSQIAGIEQQYAVRKQQQAEINRRLEEGRAQSLLMSGSSRYAQLSAEGVQSTQNTVGLLAIAQLDAEEKDLIAKAHNAQAQGNFQIMEKELTLAEEKRKEKADATTKLAEKAAEDNKKLTEKLRLVSMDTMIAKLIEAIPGITDVKIFQTLKDAGGDYTAKEVNDSIKALKPDAEKLTADINEFKAFFPDVDIKTAEGRQVFLDWKAQINATNKTLSFTEAKSLGLPASLVNKSESQVLTDLNNTVAPAWFKDMGKQDSEWEAFRKSVLDFKAGPKSSSGTKLDELLNNL